VQAAGEDVTLQEDAIAAAAQELPPAAEVAAACQFMRLPIRFDSQVAEVGAGWFGRWKCRGSECMLNCSETASSVCITFRALAMLSGAAC
jgi:hypothetical protein